MRLAWLTLGTLLAASSAGSNGPVDPRVEAIYWQALDEWVKDGGPKSELRSRVADNCYKLVITTVGDVEKATLLTTRVDELQFRVDVCTKATFHRVHPQPEFSSQMFVDMICRDSNVAVYRELCVKAKLLPDPNAT
jgi:hypothetical protein